MTERAGRPVLALRASARGAVPGIVHDSSGSGQTLFVEPFAVVEHSNRLREAESAEREEVARILAELSRRVGERADELNGPRGRRRGDRPRARAGNALAAVEGSAGDTGPPTSSCAPRGTRCSTPRPPSPSTSSRATSVRS